MCVIVALFGVVARVVNDEIAVVCVIVVCVVGVAIVAVVLL